ncbi:hypothetical protein CS542_01615 [Pedobacter sp. IW39]|nr:hypothetical protein CS542_01615 [Pedobacter sp. IW39]
MYDHQFRTDADTGKLPAVSLVCTCDFCIPAPWYGAWYHQALHFNKIQSLEEDNFRVPTMKMMVILIMYLHLQLNPKDPSTVNFSKASISLPSLYKRTE